MREAGLYALIFKSRKLGLQCSVVGSHTSSSRASARCTIPGIPQTYAEAGGARAGTVGGVDIDPSEIGQRARLIRRRRGLSLDVAAGLAGISKSYLSRLESGQRRFERRGLLEDLAGALGCSVVDLTGQPYLPADRSSADTLACLPGIREAIYDATLDDAPTALPARWRSWPGGRSRPTHTVTRIATRWPGASWERC